MVAAAITALTATSSSVIPTTFFIFRFSFSLLAFGARAGKEEGAIPVRDSVEALEKPMELAKGNAPRVGAFLASRTSMVNFPGFDRVHR